MKERFEGESGRKLLIEVLLKQDVVEHIGAFAELLADNGEVVEFPPNTDIVVQDDTDNSVFFLLAGEANVFVNDRFVGPRADGTCIGEMAAIDPSARRSATVRAKSDVVALKLSESAFRGALDKHPTAYKALAQLLAHRLRQRSQFYQPPNPEPVLFIGCSSEALPFANELQLGFKYDRISAIVWTNGVFGPSGTAVESLYRLADSADFAAFLISPDDTIISRDREVPAPRDNVIFEIGLFMGRLESRRVFLITEHGDDVKIPSDLLGITPITYVVSPTKQLSAVVAPVCTELRNAIMQIGVR